MTTLDWLILAATLLFALSGYLRGFIVGVLSLGGFLAGAIVGTRVADALLSSGAASPYAPVFGLLGALGASHRGRRDGRTRRRLHRCLAGGDRRQRVDSCERMQNNARRRHQLIELAQDP